MTIPKEIESLLYFLENSPTAWHAVEEASQTLMKEGFLRLREEDSWKLQPGCSYFVTRNGSSLCAFTLPEQHPEKAVILAAHTDSPGLKLKPNAEFRIQNNVMWGVETYGSPLLSSWLNRDLGVAGRIVYRDPAIGLTEKLVCITHAPALIPQLAIHLDKEVNDKGLLLNRQEHLSVLAALSTNLPEDVSYLEDLLMKEKGSSTLIAADLFLFPLEKPKVCGNERQLISSYRLDNLESMHACLQALLESKRPPVRTIQMAIFWDSEEIGSGTAQGAESPFLGDTLERIFCSLKLCRNDLFTFRAKSLCISVDLAHAVNPNYIAKHEPRHQPKLDGGIVLKMNANQRYATDAVSGAMIADVCIRNNIPYQKFVNRTDMPCGSTIGPLTAAKTGIRTVDIGSPVLSMHSIREILSCRDHQAMCTLLKTLLAEYC